MNDERADDEARRRYWRESMEAAYRFMEEIAVYPVAECGEGLASMKEAAREAGVEVAFSTTPIGRGRSRIFRLREGLLEDLVEVGRRMNARGWVLVVEDGYRTREMQRELGREPRVFDRILERVTWELGGETPTGELMLRRLTALVATTPKIGTHMSGSAVDVSVVRREDGAEVDRGGRYLELSERTPMESPFVSEAARRNREEITAVFAERGFRAYPYEFWHYSKGDAYAEHLAGSPEPARYGPVEVADADTGRVEAIADPSALLSSEEEIGAEMARARGRESGGAREQETGAS